jgi:hypothetical protein
MTPATRIRAARILIPVGIVIGVVATVEGVWLTVVAMTLLVLGQVVNMRVSQRKLDGRLPRRWLG